MEEALVIAERCENGREAVRQDYAAKVTGCMTSVRGQVASVHSVTDYGGLRKAIHSLTEEMRDMKVEMKLMAEDNHGMAWLSFIREEPMLLHLWWIWMPVASLP